MTKKNVPFFSHFLCFREKKWASYNSLIYMLYRKCDLIYHNFYCIFVMTKKKVRFFSHFKNENL